MYPVNTFQEKKELLPLSYFTDPKMSFGKKVALSALMLPGVNTIVCLSMAVFKGIAKCLPNEYVSKNILWSNMEKVDLRPVFFLGLPLIGNILILITLCRDVLENRNINIKILEENKKIDEANKQIALDLEKGKAAEVYDIEPVLDDQIWIKQDAPSVLETVPAVEEKAAEEVVVEPKALALHVKARGPHPLYINGDKENLRFNVPDDLVSWSKKYPGYKPAFFTTNGVLKNGELTEFIEKNGVQVKNPARWADADTIEAAQFRAQNMESYEYKSAIEIILDPQGRACNPRGRTGLEGRGALGHWGPNHAADSMVTVKDPITGETRLVVIQGKDTKEWAIPGGMVDFGEAVNLTLEREFGEEAFAARGKVDQNVLKAIAEMFKNGGTEIYKGYVDDPRNTDHAWMETVAVHFHVPDEVAAAFIDGLSADDDAIAVKTISLQDQNAIAKLYASHADFVKKIVV